MRPTFSQNIDGQDSNMNSSSTPILPQVMTSAGRVSLINLVARISETFTSQYKNYNCLNCLRDFPRLRNLSDVEVFVPYLKSARVVLTAETQRSLQEREG